MSKRPSPAFVLAAIALFVSLTGFGVAATGGNFILGQSNTADKQTALAGTINGNPVLRAENAGTGAASYGVVGKITSAAANADSAGVKGLSASTNASAAAVLGKNTGGGPGLSAIVNSGAPPLSVNSQTKVTDLNADLLDGFNSTAFLQAVSAPALTHLGSFFDNTAPIEAVPFVVRFLGFESGTISAGSSVDAVIYNANAPTTFQIIDAWLVLAGPIGCSGTCTWQLRSATGGGGSTLFQAQALPAGGTGQPGDIVRLASLPSFALIGEGSSVVLRFTNPGPGTGSAGFDLYVLALPV